MPGFSERRPQLRNDGYARWMRPRPVLGSVGAGHAPVLSKLAGRGLDSH
jgi:hypothetical protein